MEASIAVLAGDGIGPEVMFEAVKVLRAVGQKFSHKFHINEALIGGAAWDVYGEHFPTETKLICSDSQAILFGSIGGPVSEMDHPKWKDSAAKSLLALRKEFSFNANFRPIKVFPELLSISPLRQELVSAGIDLLIVRELLGDLYFGEHKTEIVNGEKVAFDVCQYSVSQIRSVAEVAFRAALTRKQKLTSVDKVNVLETSKLWREVVVDVSKNYPQVQLEHMLVDNCAMQIIKNPAQFDVILTSNMFGDILSDAAAVLPGSLGLLSSASINAQGFGMFEPPGGSAPDIAGRNIANPIGQILCVASMLQHTFGLLQEARAIENAVSAVLKNGFRTADITAKVEPVAKEFEEKIVGTKEMGARIIEQLIASS